MTPTSDNPERQITHRSGVGVPEGASRAAGPSGHAALATPRVGDGRGVRMSGAVRTASACRRGLFPCSSRRRSPCSKGNRRRNSTPSSRRTTSSGASTYRHKELDKQVLDAELGVLPVDDRPFADEARELAAKDRLTRMYDVLHH